MTGPASVVIEADGGSRGNPGPAAYGAVLKDAATGAVLAEDGSTIGVATNNVAEYSGLIAGLELAAEFAPDADIEVRMDSKLVVEQMSGRWKIKHPDMRPLAAEATRLAPSGTTYTWVPREQNKHADRLANEALDGKRSGVTAAGAALVDEPDPGEAQGEVRVGPPQGPPTTLLLVRHGVTAHTAALKLSGGLKSANPGLSEEGRAQVRATADWLAPLAAGVDAVVASPVRRTMESAAILAERLGRSVEVEPGFAEMEFGQWDGLTLAEVAERAPAAFREWIGSLDRAAPGGESQREVQTRVLAGLDRLIDTHAGRTVVVVSHVNPIKSIVARAIGAPLGSVFRLELSPASVTVVSFWAGQDRSTMRLFNARPPGDDAFSPAASAW